MARSRLRLGLFALAILVVLAGGVFYVLRVALSDHIAFREGDAAYLIVVNSETVHEFPRFSARRGADFTYSARDGTAPGRITMSYASKDVVNSLERQYLHYCTQQRFETVPEAGRFLASRLACDAPDYRIEIDLQPRDGESLVTVVFLEQ